MILCGCGAQLEDNEEWVKHARKDFPPLIRPLPRKLAKREEVLRREREAIVDHMRRHEIVKSEKVA